MVSQREGPSTHDEHDVPSPGEWLYARVKAPTSRPRSLQPLPDHPRFAVARPRPPPVARSTATGVPVLMSRAPPLPPPSARLINDPEILDPTPGSGRAPGPIRDGPHDE